MFFQDSDSFTVNNDQSKFKKRLSHQVSEVFAMFASVYIPNQWLNFKLSAGFTVESSETILCKSKEIFA